MKAIKKKPGEVKDSKTVKKKVSYTNNNEYSSQSEPNLHSGKTGNKSPKSMKNKTIKKKVSYTNNNESSSQSETNFHSGKTGNTSQKSIKNKTKEKQVSSKDSSKKYKPTNKSIENVNASSNEQVSSESQSKSKQKKTLSSSISLLASKIAGSFKSSKSKNKSKIKENKTSSNDSQNMQPLKYNCQSETFPQFGMHPFYSESTNCKPKSYNKSLKCNFNKYTRKTNNDGQQFLYSKNKTSDCFSKSSQDFRQHFEKNSIKNLNFYFKNIGLMLKNLQKVKEIELSSNIGYSKINRLERFVLSSRNQIAKDLCRIDKNYKKIINDITCNRKVDIEPEEITSNKFRVLPVSISHISFKIILKFNEFFSVYNDWLPGCSPGKIYSYINDLSKDLKLLQLKIGNFQKYTSCRAVCTTSNESNDDINKTGNQFQKKFHIEISSSSISSVHSSWGESKNIKRNAKSESRSSDSLSHLFKNKRKLKKIRNIIQKNNCKSSSASCTDDSYKSQILLEQIKSVIESSCDSDGSRCSRKSRRNNQARNKKKSKNLKTTSSKFQKNRRSSLKNKRSSNCYKNHRKLTFEVSSSDNTSTKTKSSRSRKNKVKMKKLSVYYSVHTDSSDELLSKRLNWISKSCSQ